MKILITGAKGQVGQTIVRAALQHTVEIIPCDRHALDITNAKTVEHSIAHYRPDLVINTAAYTAVDRAEAESVLATAINAQGPRYLARACKHANIPLFHLSTDYIFDGQKAEPYNEDDVAAPLSVYGLSKWQGEQAIRDEWDMHIILRVSWVFGEYGQNFVKTMLRLMQERETLTVVADQYGCPTYADDIAHTLLTIANTTQWGTYHYCGQPVTTWYEFANTIYRQASILSPLKVQQIHAITTADYPTPAQRPKNAKLNCQKFTDTFGISLSDWQVGLERMLEQLLK